MSTKKNESAATGLRPGVGLDIGTMNIVAARNGEGSADHTRMRDAFLDLEQDAKRMLKLTAGVNYMEHGDKLLVLGDSALEVANLVKREARRPLSRGVISAGELDAQEVLSLLVESVLGKPRVADEHCFYSVPAAPIDDPSQDIIFHTEIFRKIITEQGYTAHPTNEALAIVLSQCAEDMFSGLAVSFGSGMCNIALAYKTTLAMEFSLARGGDWIDGQSSKAVGKTASQMCFIKEKGVDLNNPKTREQQAIALYVRSLISYCLQNIAAQFRSQTSIELPEPIPFIISGGTSKATGFLDLFKQEFEVIKKKGFPIEISEIRHATDPMTAVADGLLVLAVEEYD